MAVRKTNAQWVRQVRELVGDEYIFKEDYHNRNTKIAVKHVKCGTEYSVTPGAFLHGNRCPNCNPSRRRTTAEFKEIVFNLVGDEYLVVSEYTGHHSPVTMYHVECGSRYDVVASDFIKGRRCKKCYFKSKRKTNEEWLEQVKKLAGDDYQFLEHYKGDDTKIAYKHSCGATHQVTPNNFINGTRCPACRESQGEANVRRYLEELGIPYEPQKSFEGLKNKKHLSYDFYIPDRGVLIEYNGQQHYKSIEFFGGKDTYEKQVINDRLKKEFACSLGYKLIEIPYTYKTYEEVKELLDNTMSDNPNAV